MQLVGALPEQASLLVGLGAVKVTEWVLTVVVRWVYRTVCTIVTLVVGALALVVGNTAILRQAISDLWELAKDVVFTVLGAIIFVALWLVDIVQNAIGKQRSKRKLTERERTLLHPIFRDSLNYNAVRIVDGNAGLLTITGRALTMGFTIYLPAYAEHTLVYECVHVWQFEFGGFRYIGNSALNQLNKMVFNKAYEPYAWQGAIDAGATWYTLKSVEAQAQFIEDVYRNGIFDFTDPALINDTSPGAFFQQSKAGNNKFEPPGGNYTAVANDAWRILRTA